MKEKNSIRLSEIERKWLDGTISEGEAALYSRWYNWGQDQKVFVPESIASSFEEHHQKLFNKVLVSIRPPAQLKRLVRYSVAAALVLAVIITGVLIMRHPSGHTTKTNDMEPGREGMTLTLNDGRQILLDSVKDGLIAVQDGVNIYKQNGKIEYEGSRSSTMINSAMTATGRQYQIVLPDQSKVWLNAQSELKYPITFAAAERRVMLKGEAYFEIQHTPNYTPFIVSTGNKEVRVLGTHFNVHAYEDEDSITATLLEGAIALQSDRNTKAIQPNQAAVSSREDSSIRVENVDAAASIMWLHHEFNFENLTLEEIMRKIKRWYGVQIIYEPGVDRHASFNGSTPMNQNLSEVLKVLELSGVHFHLENGVLTVMK